MLGLRLGNRNDTIAASGFPTVCSQTKIRVYTSIQFIQRTQLFGLEHIVRDALNWVDLHKEI